MPSVDPLTLAVREHAAWCDLVCRLHRFTPEGDARPPGAGAEGEVASTFVVVREKLPFVAWCRAWGGPTGVLPTGLRRAPGVTVLGREGGAAFADGAILHRTQIGGTTVAGLWNAFGTWADVAAAASHRHPEAWIVGYERGPDLDTAHAAGFTAIGPFRVWHRELGGR